MTSLEQEVADLRRQLASVVERVRLSAVAESFLQQKHEIREGDYFLYYKEFATKLSSVNSEGKWTFFDGHHSVEPFRIPDQADHERLYTIAEVAEIVALTRKERDDWKRRAAKHGCDVEKGDPDCG